MSCGVLDIAMTITPVLGALLLQLGAQACLSRSHDHRLEEEEEAVLVALGSSL